MMRYLMFLLLLWACSAPQVPPNTSDLQEFCTDDVGPYISLFEELADQSISGKQYKYLVIHTTASSPNSAYTKESLLRFFEEDRGWSRPGYRDFVDKKGKIHNLRPYNGDDILSGDEITYGARGYNSVSMHIAYDGGVDYVLTLAGKQLVPTDTRTKEQKTALYTYISVVKTIYPNIIVLGHRDLPGVTKACPSFDAAGEYGGIDFNLADIFLMPTSDTTEFVW